MHEICSLISFEIYVYCFTWNGNFILIVFVLNLKYSSILIQYYVTMIVLTNKCNDFDFIQAGVGYVSCDKQGSVISLRRTKGIEISVAYR
jgi:hypothetical protein